MLLSADLACESWPQVPPQWVEISQPYCLPNQKYYHFV